MSDFRSANLMHRKTSAAGTNGNALRITFRFLKLFLELSFSDIIFHKINYTNNLKMKFVEQDKIITIKNTD